jgi:hypothetical protein
MTGNLGGGALESLQSCRKISTASKNIDGVARNLDRVARYLERWRENWTGWRDISKGGEKSGQVARNLDGPARSLLAIVIPTLSASSVTLIFLFANMTSMLIRHGFL